MKNNSVNKDSAPQQESFSELLGHLAKSSAVMVHDEIELVKKGGIGRSSKDIRQDLDREEESLSRTAHEIGDRIKEKLDWSEYVKDSPYWALGIAIGIGFLASRVLQRRTTPMERIMGSLSE